MVFISFLLPVSHNLVMSMGLSKSGMGAMTSGGKKERCEEAKEGGASGSPFKWLNRSCMAAAG